MHILVTNDDGIQAAGLHALAQALRPLGDVTVLAPDRNWSASGHVKTMHRPLRVREVELPDGTPALSSDGAPSDCVALAVLGVLDRPIDMVVSGINPNANLGHDVTYSGTVTAAMEAAIQGLPGIAVSLDTPEGHSGARDYTPAAEVAASVARKVMQDGLPRGLVLNVNVPYGPRQGMRGVAITRQGLRVYRDELVRRLDPRGRPYYWIGGESPSGLSEPDTDFWALRENYISITPLQLDLTATDQLPLLRAWGPLI
ncbi:MAG TPA: 5'/3'-nucleotidase SurE [Anaerolineales bacterium]|nr:5'/3'-nucleotidase SurE [Anaerolineales bacterium]